MKESDHLYRFIDAQQDSYAPALAEIKSGRKRTHWMWYVFPQLRGLGSTEISNHYGIKDLKEAKAYLDHPVLGLRLKQISMELLQLSNTNAQSIFGSPDDLKLRSCMTLFNQVDGADPIFQQVLDRFFNGEKDKKTLTLLSL